MDLLELVLLDVAVITKCLQVLVKHTGRHGVQVVTDTDRVLAIDVNTFKVLLGVVITLSPSLR